MADSVGTGGDTASEDMRGALGSSAEGYREDKRSGVTQTLEVRGAGTTTRETTTWGTSKATESMSIGDTFKAGRSLERVEGGLAAAGTVLAGATTVVSAGTFADTSGVAGGKGIFEMVKDIETTRVKTNTSVVRSCLKDCKKEVCGKKFTSSLCPKLINQFDPAGGYHASTCSPPDVFSPCKTTPCPSPVCYMEESCVKTCRSSSPVGLSDISMPGDLFGSVKANNATAGSYKSKKTDVDTKREFKETLKDVVLQGLELVGAEPPPVTAALLNSSAVTGLEVGFNSLANCLSDTVLGGSELPSDLSPLPLDGSFCSQASCDEPSALGCSGTSKKAWDHCVSQHAAWEMAWNSCYNSCMGTCDCSHCTIMRCTTVPCAPGSPSTCKPTKSCTSTTDQSCVASCMATCAVGCTDDCNKTVPQSNYPWNSPSPPGIQVTGFKLCTDGNAAEKTGVEAVGEGFCRVYMDGCCRKCETGDPGCPGSSKDIEKTLGTSVAIINPGSSGMDCHDVEGKDPGGGVSDW